MFCVRRNQDVPADVHARTGAFFERDDGQPIEEMIQDLFSLCGRLLGDAVADLSRWCEHAAVVADLGKTQLRNIAEPIRVYSLRVGVPVRAQPKTAVQAAAPKKRSALAPLAAAAAWLILIGGGAWWVLAGEGSYPPGAARLSIVVLPFANLSNDPAQDYFADGITENLTTDLSRIRDSFVIARNTAFAFKGKNQIGRASCRERVW